MPKCIVGLDIGSYNICATMSIENEDNEFEVLDFVCKKSVGISKGNVTDVIAATDVIRECLQDLEKATGRDVQSVYLGVSSENCRIISTRGYTYIGHGSTVTEKNIEDAYLDGKNILLQSDECVVDGIVNFFYTDEHGFTKNPVGLVASKLEVDIDVIVSKKSIIGDLKSIVLNSGYNVSGLVLSVDSLKNIFLSENTSLSNVAIIDVGSEKTEIALYKNNQLKGIGFIPLGGKNITKDLSICLEIPENTAEALKVELSQDYITMAEDDVIDIGEKEVECRFISEVMDARLDEITEYAYNEIISSGLYEEIDFLVITGEGINYFENIKEKIENKFDKNVKIFTKNHFYFNNSSIITSISIVKEVYDRLKLICDEKLLSNSNVVVDEIEETNNKKIKKRGLSRVKAFLDEIF